MARKVAVVTDSSAMLPAQVAERCGIAVVPLQVVIDGEAFDEGEPDATPAAVTAALTNRRRSVTTSRAAPGVLAASYADLAEQGADEVISIHLSAEMSGTVESAQIAARTAPIPVRTLDVRAVGPCVGFAAEAAAVVADESGDVDAAVAAARARAGATRSFFYVHTLEYLRRGGRIGTAAAMLGSALAVKPLLAIEDGQVVLHERVRTSSRALQRLQELALEAAGGDAGRVHAVVAHLDAETRAGQLAEALDERLGERLADDHVGCAEVAAALGVHVGPGMLAAVIAPAL